MFDPKLETLILLSETRNYTRTAQLLRLTQPAVSQHIRQLEKEYNCKLFSRLGGELTLTEQGNILVRFARQIRSVYDRLNQRLDDFRKHSGRIAVGLTHTAESNVMAEVLAKYCTGNDGVCITIHTDTLPHLFEMLEQDEIDLAVVEGKLPENADLCAIPLDTDSLMLAVSSAHPLANRHTVSLEELQKEKMILRLPDSETRKAFLKGLDEQKLSLADFNVVLQVDNIATIKDLVIRNFGISILAKSACMEELKKGKLKLLPIDNLKMLREINLVHRRNFSHPEILTDLTQTYYAMTSRTEV